jgi:DNA-binding response OmpR family regulator
MTDERAPRVLVVDDDHAVARMLRAALTVEGFTVRVATSGEQALAEALAFLPDVVVLDLQMPVMDGRAFFHQFRQRGFQSPVIVISAWNAEKARKELGAQGSLEKPCDPSEVNRMIASVLSEGHK